MAGYVVLGIGFGILFQSHGYGWGWALLMSIFVFAGSMQYVAVDLLSAGAGFITMAVVTLAVNARHLFYGLAMLVKYRDMGKAKPYLIFALTDETFSLVCDADLPANVDRKYYYLILSALNQSYWVTGSVIGAILGAALPFDFLGIDFSMTALFAVTVINQWEKAESHLPALTGFASAIICLLAFGPDNFLIPTMVAIALLLLLEGKFKKGVSEDVC